MSEKPDLTPTGLAALGILKNPTALIEYMKIRGLSDLPTATNELLQFITVNVSDNKMTENDNWGEKTWGMVIGNLLGQVNGR